MTAERVIQAAMALTREHGLEGWTIRDLAAAVDAWPNAIAHHVGDREAILHAVVGEVVSLMTNPPAELGWQEWFRTFLNDGRSVLIQYVGVARRLCRDGPTVSSAMPIMDRGVGLLHDAGFGTQAPGAYALLLNGPLLLVALDQDRLAAGLAGDQPPQAMLSMPAPPQAGVGWKAMQRHLSFWLEDPASSREQMFRDMVDTLIAGLEVRLAHLQS